MTAIVIDTETTGLDPTQERIIELAIVEYETGEVLFNGRFNPGRSVPPAVIEITKITDADLTDKPTFAQVACVVGRLIASADAVIGFNTYFDVSFLKAEFERLTGSDDEVIGLQWPPIVCASKFWKEQAPRNLSNAYKEFVNPLGFEGAHGALADTHATRHVLMSQIREFAPSGAKPWAEFHPVDPTWVGNTNHLVHKDGVVICGFGKWKGTPCHEIPQSYWEWVSGASFPEHVKMFADYCVSSKTKHTADDLYGFAYGKLMR